MGSSYSISETVSFFFQFLPTLTKNDTIQRAGQMDKNDINEGGGG